MPAKRSTEFYNYIPGGGYEIEKQQLMRRRQQDNLLKGRTFTYVREFHLPEDKRVLNILGRKVRHGFLIQDNATGEHVIVGLRLLRNIADRYEGIELPPEVRLRRAEHSIVRQPSWYAAQEAKRRPA